MPPTPTRTTYNAFLRGRRSTTELAQEWDRRFNGGQRFGGAPARRTQTPTLNPEIPTVDNTRSEAYADPAPPKPPDFDPSILDAEGERQRTDLDARNRQAESDINTDYEVGKGRLEAKRPLLEHDRNQGYEGVDSGASARGVFNSGIRTKDRGEVFRNYSQGVQQLESDLQDNQTRRDRALTEQRGNYADQSTRVRTDAAERRLSEYRRQYGGL